MFLELSVLFCLKFIWVLKKEENQLILLCLLDLLNVLSKYRLHLPNLKIEYPFIDATYVKKLVKKEINHFFIINVLVLGLFVVKVVLTIEMNYAKLILRKAL